MKSLILASFLLATPALAQQAHAAQPPFRACPYFTIGWSLQSSGPITSVQYESSKQILYVVFNNSVASAFSNVPLSVQQSFSQATTQEQIQSIYQRIVLPAYHALALNEVDNCPLRFENGPYIWTTPAGVQPVFQPCPAIWLWPQVRPDYYTPTFYDPASQILYLAVSYARSLAYQPVPQSVVTQIETVQNPQSIYASLPKDYHEVMLSNPDNCPLRAQSGAYLWSD